MSSQSQTLIFLCAAFTFLSHIYSSHPSRIEGPGARVLLAFPSFCFSLFSILLGKEEALRLGTSKSLPPWGPRAQSGTSFSKQHWQMAMAFYWCAHLLMLLLTRDACLPTWHPDHHPCGAIPCLWNQGCPERGGDRMSKPFSGILGYRNYAVISSSFHSLCLGEPWLMWL